MERPNERLARYVVHDATGMDVTRFEDGKAPAQVDALIWTRDGPMPLEIVAQHDSAFNKQWDALSKVGHEISVPALKRRWIVQLDRMASVKRIVAELPSLLIGAEAEWTEARRGSMSWDMPEAISVLGVQFLYPIETSQRTGTVSLRTEGWAGFVNHDPIGTFVEDVLSKASDVARKLAKHPGKEKHAFIWATIGSGFSVHYALERHEEQVLPEASPNLPNGVTHVWVAGTLASQGVVAWFPNIGWWRPRWRVPDQGPLNLGGFV